MLGAILGAAGGLLGNLFSSSSASKEAAANREAQERMAAQNIALQKEFAQSGIRWKVEDAKAAGIHPLYALGAAGTSFSPVSIGTTTSDQPDWGKTLSSMGQDIGGAIERTRTAPERAAAMATTMGQLQIEGARLDNDIKRAAVASSIQRLRANANPPMAGINPGDAEMPWAPSEKKKSPLARLNLGFGEFTRDPNTSPANDFTNEFGEPAEWAVSPWLLWRAYKHNFPDVDIDSSRAVAEQRMADYWKDVRWWNFLNRKPHGRLGPDRMKRYRPY